MTDFGFKVFVIDLTTSPPSLAPGTNPILISNRGQDLSISPDGKFLVVSGETVFGQQPISVIDIAAQAEISIFSTDADTNSVDVCSDGSVLATSFLSNTVRRLTLSNTGILTDTGEVLSLSVNDPVGDPLNVYCAPGALSGVVIGFGGVTSFTIPGLSAVDTRPLPDGDEFTGTINSIGNRVFVRSTFPGSIDVFDFNPATGALGTSPLLTFSVANGNQYSGIEQIALHPNGGKLFVTSGAFLEPDALNVYNPDTGALLASITDPNINIFDPTGVTVVTEADPCAGSPPAGAIVGTNGSNSLVGTPRNDKIFGLGGSDAIDGRGGDDLICGGSGSDLINGGAGNDTIDAGPGSDTANGDTGNDIIKGGSGSDLITGGAGDDVLDAQDRVNGNDSANGGTHVSGDTCTADPGDGVSNCSP